MLTRVISERHNGQPETNVIGRVAARTSSCCALALSSETETETQTKTDLLDLCFGAFFSGVWLLLRLEGGSGVVQAGHGSLHPPLLNHRLQLTDALLVVSHLQR